MLPEAVRQVRGARKALPFVFAIPRDTQWTSGGDMVILENSGHNRWRIRIFGESEQDGKVVVRIGKRELRGARYQMRADSVATEMSSKNRSGTAPIQPMHAV